jgi:hypothetical protein
MQHNGTGHLKKIISIQLLKRGIQGETGNLLQAILKHPLLE